jgi:hypothetical protein
VNFEIEIKGVPSEDVLRDLVRRAREEGADRIIIRTTHEAGDAWIRAGFAETSRVLEAPVEELERHLGAHREPSFGSIQVQSDDVEAILRAVRQYVPRLPGGSQGSIVLPPAEGWTSVYDELCDREPEMLRRLAREISDRMGAFVISMGVEEGAVVRYVALERGRVVDEYLSNPEHYGPLPPGDVIAMGANPRLMARLTGAKPEDVRAAAHTAKSADELPPPAALLAELARVFHVPRGAYGYEQAAQEPGAVPVSRQSST